MSTRRELCGCSAATGWSRRYACNERRGKRLPKVLAAEAKLARRCCSLLKCHGLLTVVRPAGHAKLALVTDLGPPGARMSGKALAARIRAEAEKSGFAAVGFAGAGPLSEAREILEQRKAAGLAAGMQFTYRNPARSTDPRRALPGAESIVVCAWSYPPPQERDSSGAAAGLGQPPARPQGRVAAYATGDHYGALRAALGGLASVVEAEGWATRVLCDDNALVDRAAAQRAGLGWFGKNCNLLLPGRGSWFVLGSVLTDAPLPRSVPVEPGCGPCRRCLVSCPTGALVGPGVLDARKCLAWLVQAPGVFPRQYRAAVGDRIYGCDDCQEVCPPNRAQSRAQDRRHGGDGRPAPGGCAHGADRPASPHHGPTVDLLDLLGATDEQLLVTYGRWYVPRREPRYLRRNALIALGNLGHQGQAGGPSGDAAAMVARYLAGPDELLRAHAVWAAYRAGWPALVRQHLDIGAETSALVLEELAMAPDGP